MKHFPIFLAVEGRRIVVAGGGESALAKLRVLLKTEAHLTVVATSVAPEISGWAREGRLNLIERAQEPGDALCAALFYAANDDDAEDARVAALARADGALVNIVDNLGESQFITPAIVDRDPVIVAIGTEGAAPVLARAIKTDLEDRLPPTLGLLARVGKAFRPMAEQLPTGRTRREFWAEYFFDKGPRAAIEGASGIRAMLDELLNRHLGREARKGHVDFVGAGPGDPDLLTLMARKALDQADVVIHDRLVSAPVLELARREAVLIEAGKTGFGPSTPQQAINDLMVRHAQAGAHVVRLKSGDATIFGRLDEEIEAIEQIGVSWRIVPGITAASAAVAGVGQSLTRRGRNASVRFLTGHDINGFAEHEWRALARPGEVAAVYMGKKGARFLQGRLMMHGADPATPVSVVENASRPDQRVVSARLANLSDALDAARLTGPAVILYGLAPRAALAVSETFTQEIAL